MRLEESSTASATASIYEVRDPEVPHSRALASASKARLCPIPRYIGGRPPGGGVYDDILSLNHQPLRPHGTPDAVLGGAKNRRHLIIEPPTITTRIFMPGIYEEV